MKLNKCQAIAPKRSETFKPKNAAGKKKRPITKYSISSKTILPSKGNIKTLTAQ